MARLRIVRAAPRLVGVTITPADAESEVGQAVQFTAAGVDQYGAPFPVSGGTWVSSNPAVATIDASGRSDGMSVGEVEITYTVEGQSFS